MKRENTSAWDASEHLYTEEDISAYLEAALAEDDPALIAAVHEDIARARGMKPIASVTIFADRIEFNTGERTISISFSQYPELMNATAAQLLAVRMDEEELHIDGIDFDIALESLTNPNKFSLKYN